MNWWRVVTHAVGAAVYVLALCLAVAWLWVRLLPRADADVRVFLSVLSVLPLWMGAMWWVVWKERR